MADYEYDIFVSYSSASTVPAWLNEHLLTVFCEECVNEWGDEHFRVFNWREDDIGSRWPETIRSAHARSRIMISILTPSYFRNSQWCRAEWDTMEAREQHCQIPATRSLIYPILFSDGNNLPQNPRLITYEDFRPYSYPERGFRDTAVFTEFRGKIRQMLPRLDALVQSAPQFSVDWPQIDLDQIQLQPLTRI
jgi:hypothetical protein